MHKLKVQLPVRKPISTAKGEENQEQDVCPRWCRGRAESCAQLWWQPGLATATGPKPMGSSANHENATNVRAPAEPTCNAVHRRSSPGAPVRGSLDRRFASFETEEELLQSKYTGQLRAERIESKWQMRFRNVSISNHLALERIRGALLHGTTADHRHCGDSSPPRPKLIWYQACWRAL